MDKSKTYTYTIVTWTLWGLCGFIGGVILSIVVLIVPLFFQ